MNDTQWNVRTFGVFDDLNGLPNLKGAQAERDTIFTFLWYVFLVLVSGCSKLMFSSVPPNVVYSFMLMVGWVVGHVFVEYLPKYWSSIGVNDLLVINVIPILFYYATYRVDYHTLVSSLGLILVVTLPVLLYHYAIIILITYTVLNEKFRWGVQVIWLFAIGVGVIQVDHCVQELNRVQGQMRILQLVLLGERFISFAVASIVQNIIVRYYNPILPTQHGRLPVLLIIVWTGLAIFVAIIYAQLYRYALKYFYKDIVSQVTLNIAAIYFLFWVMEALRANGSLSVLCFGIATGYSKIKYSSASERFFGYFWKTIYYICVSLVFATVGFYLGVKPHWVMSEMWGFCFLIYVLLIIARALGFVTAYPLVSRFGYQISMKHFIIAIVGVNRSTVSLVYAFLNKDFSHGYILVQFCAIIVLASTFFNVVLLQKYLSVFDMYKMSRSRVVNMNVALVQMNECREKCIRSLKMDRLIADSNWLIVDQITKLPHPYADIMDDVQTDESIRGTKSARFMKCHDCGTELEIPPTQAEYGDMLLEAKQRILKAQLVCFWKQHENGTLTRQGVSILNNLIEGAAVKEDPKLNYKDLRIQREGSATLRCLKNVFGHLFTVTSVTHRFIPTNIIRATCFRLCTLRSYRTIMAVLTLIDLFIICAMLRIYYFSSDLKNKISEFFFFQICDVGFFFIFLVDFLINILGIGISQYFCIHVNKIEFAGGQLIRANQLCMYIHTCIVSDSLYNVFLASETIFVQKAMMLVRFSRIYVFIVALIPKIMVMIDQKLDQDLIRYYDMGKAYLISLNRVSYFLNHIADNEIVYRELLKDVEADRHLVTRELGLIQKDRPTIAVSNKTLHAIRHVIMCMGDCISSMKDEGLLDPAENRSLVVSLERVKKRLLRYNLVQPSQPDRILFDVPWLCDDNETPIFLLKHAKMSTYQEHEKIIYYGDDALGLYVLISGMVRCHYRTSSESVKNVNHHGVLPNCDYFTKLEFDVSQTELVVSGNILGELGLVTGRRYDMEVMSETRVQVYYIPWKILKVMIHDSSNSALIQAKIWKSIGIKIAVHLLHNTARFQGWQDYRILLYLERGIVPLLDGVESLYVSDFVDDVILIEGKLMDYASRKVYVAPCCIPRVSSQRLVLPGTTIWDAKVPCPPKVLIIPSAEAEMEDIMSMEGLFKYTYQDTLRRRKSEDCEPQHSPQSYISRLVQAQRRRRMITQFMDYMPTIAGAVEGLPVSSTYIEKGEKRRIVKPGPHPRTRIITHQDTIQYTQDIEEQSEIGILKDENEDDDTIFEGKRSSRHRSSSRKKSTTVKKSSGSYGSERLSSYYRYSTRDNTKKAELVVVEYSEDEEEQLNSKATQTKIRKITKSPTPDKPSSKDRKAQLFS